VKNKNLFFLSVLFLLFGGVNAQAGKDSTINNKTPPSSSDEMPGGEIHDGPFLSDPDTEVHTSVDISPECMGGRAALMNHFKKHGLDTITCKAMNKDKELVLKFVINSRGNITRIKVFRDSIDCPSFTANSIQFLTRGPRWVPGLKQGKFVSSWYTLTLNGKLE
jgi:hypothetical protein